MAMLGCDLPKGADRIQDNQDAAKGFDTIYFRNRVQQTKNEIKAEGMGEISDSIRFYLYNVLFDLPIQDSTFNGEPYFCFYSLLPISIERTDYSVAKGDDSVVIIGYQLVMEDEEKALLHKPTLYDFYVEYSGSRNSSVFVRERMAILSISYLSSRIETDDYTEALAFITKHRKHVSRWYLNELSRRGILK